MSLWKVVKAAFLAGWYGYREAFHHEGNSRARADAEAGRRLHLLSALYKNADQEAERRIGDRRLGLGEEDVGED